jgi:modulator of FtsH protease
LIAYDPSEWSDLFVAAAGASAALAGLVFVAISINLDRIIGEAGLPDRALETVLLLVLVLLVSLVGLIPGQSSGALGTEVLFLSLTVATVVFRLPTIGMGGTGGFTPPRAWVWTRWGVRLAATVPFVAGGLGLLLEAGGGLYWVVAGIVFATVGAIANAWVLLVEILR